MNTINKSELLPSHYTEVSEPSFEGKGNHSVFQLENICEQYKELVHQLRIREQMILKTFNITITNGESVSVNSNPELENTCSSPLVLRWDDVTSQYKVSKPNDQSGEYVDKKVADTLLETLKMCHSLLQSQYGEGYKEWVEYIETEKVIKQAQKHEHTNSTTDKSK